MSPKRKLATAATGLAAAALAAGGAYAANQGSGGGFRQAFLGDVASRLHVTPAQLDAALKGALHDQLQAAVRAGRLTQAQANAIEQRAARPGAELPGFGPRFWLHGHRFGGPGRAGELAGAARYLGLSRQALVAQLRSGKTLAQVAKARNKPVSGLEAAMIASARQRLDRLVSAKVITSAEEQKILGRLQSRVAEIVNRPLRRRGFAGDGPAEGPGGPPPWALGAAPPPPDAPGAPSAPPPPGAPPAPAY